MGRKNDDAKNEDVKNEDVNDTDEKEKEGGGDVWEAIKEGLRNVEERLTKLEEKKEEEVIQIHLPDLPEPEEQMEPEEVPDLPEQEPEKPKSRKKSLSYWL